MIIFKNGEKSRFFKKKGSAGAKLIAFKEGIYGRLML
jgi:hypothetical protein